MTTQYDPRNFVLVLDALRDVLRAAGVLNRDTHPEGPELLLAAKDYVESVRLAPKGICGAYAEYWAELSMPAGWEGCPLPKGHEGNHGIPNIQAKKTRRAEKKSGRWSTPRASTVEDVLTFIAGKPLSLEVGIYTEYKENIGYVSYFVINDQKNNHTNWWVNVSKLPMESHQVVDSDI